MAVPYRHQQLAAQYPRLIGLPTHADKKETIMKINRIPEDTMRMFFLFHFSENRIVWLKIRRIPMNGRYNLCSYTWSFRFFGMITTGRRKSKYHRIPMMTSGFL